MHWAEKEKYNVKAVRSDLTVNAAAVPSNVRPIYPEMFGLASIGEGVTSAPELVEVSDITLSVQIDEMAPIKICSAIWLVNALMTTLKGPCLVRQHSHNNYEIVENVSNLNLITELPIHCGGLMQSTFKSSRTPLAQWI